MVMKGEFVTQESHPNRMIRRPDRIICNFSDKIEGLLLVINFNFSEKNLSLKATFVVVSIGALILYMDALEDFTVLSK